MTGDENLGSLIESAASNDKGDGSSGLAPGVETMTPPAIKRNTGFFELTALFALAMLLRCLFNFVLPHVNNFASCDAYEYINNGQALLQVSAQSSLLFPKALASLLGSASPADVEAVRAALVPMKDFAISGPVFPAFLAMITAAVGGGAANVHSLWQSLLLGNSLVSALTCVFIAMITNEAFDRRSARVAGIVSAFYPGFIVNSGRLYSETFATFLLVALSYICIRGFRKEGNSFVLVFASGFLAAALQLTRSVMFILSLILIPLTAIQQKGKRRLTFLLPFALGFALVAAPWLGFQKLAFGGGGLVVDRVGHYNFFIGNNTDTQGWLSYPYPDGRNVESRSFPQLFKSALGKSPLRWARLMLDKPLRLFKYPWNDFRTAIGPFAFGTQVIFQELLILFACVGFGISLFLSVAAKPEKREMLCRFYLAGLFAFHFIYCLFITVPRYNLSAMPELIIFAAAGAATLSQLIQDAAKRKTAVLFTALLCLLFLVLRINLIAFLLPLVGAASLAWVVEAVVRVSILAAVVYFFVQTVKVMNGSRPLAITTGATLCLCMLPLFAMPLRANGRTLEWQRSLSNTSGPVHQAIKIPISAINSVSDIYLAIDAEGVRQGSDGFAVKVNGLPVTSPILPSMAFAEDFDRFLEIAPNSVQREGERMWDSLTSSAGIANSDLRQWSLICLPKEQLKKAADLAAEAHADSVTVQVEMQNKSSQPLSVFGSYDAKDKERILPSLSVYSWEKVFYGVENPNGLTDTRYDIKVPAATLISNKLDLSEESGLQNGAFNMAILLAPPSPAGNERKLVASFELPDCAVDKNKGKSLEADLDKLAKDKDALWLFRVSGRTRVKDGNGAPSVQVESSYLRKDGSNFLYKSAWTPRRLNYSSDWKDFDIIVPVKPIVQESTAVKGIVDLSLLSPSSAYLNVDKPFSGTAEFSGLRLDVYVLPYNPIGLGHQVY